MSRLVSAPILLSAVILVTLCVGVAAGQFWEFPPLPPPEDFGDLLLDRLSSAKGQKPVLFSHWIHRVRYTCRVCHFELEFDFKNGGTEITEEDNQNGLYCGACHDGTVAFGHTERNCKLCHSGTKRDGATKFEEYRNRLPEARYGNRIDWVRAADVTKPAYSIFSEERPLGFAKLLILEADWANIPPAEFPHNVHIRLLDCSNCHPDIFNVKKKTTKHFAMGYLLEGKFCGVCHMTVAFPLNDCKRCHPGMRRKT